MDFKDVVKMVEDSEKRVDEMLKAARLERHERQLMDFETTKVRAVLCSRYDSHGAWIYGCLHDYLFCMEMKGWLL